MSGATASRLIAALAAVAIPLIAPAQPAAAVRPAPVAQPAPPQAVLPTASTTFRTAPSGTVTESAPIGGSDPVDNGPQVDDSAAGVITTAVGGSADGAPALESTFAQPHGAAAGPDGTIYVADTYANRIRAVDPLTHVVRTIAGSGDAGMSGDGGAATNASLNFPTTVAVAGEGVYVADTWNDRIRRVDLGTGTITTIAGIGPNDAAGNPPCGRGLGGPATALVIEGAEGFAVSASGDIFIADTGCDAIIRIDHAGNTTVVAGSDGLAGSPANGVATAQRLDHPFAVALDPLGNPIFADDSNQLWYVNVQAQPVSIYPKSAAPLAVAPGNMQSIAGNGSQPTPTTADGDGGPATRAQLASAHGLTTTTDAVLFTEDAEYTTADGSGYQDTMRLRRIDWSTGIVTKVAGNEQAGSGGDGISATQSALSYPEAAFVQRDGSVAIVDSGNHRLRRVDAAGIVSTVTGRPNHGSPPLGDGLPATAATLDWPRAVAVDPSSGTLFVNDSYGLRIRRVDPATGVIDTIIGNGAPCVRAGVGWHLCEDEAQPPDAQPGLRMSLLVNNGTGMAASPSGLLAFVDYDAVWVYNGSASPITLFGQSAHPLTVRHGWVQRVAGLGSKAVPPTGSAAATDTTLQWPAGLAFTGHELLFSEQQANRIDTIDLENGQVSILAGAPYTIPQYVGPVPVPSRDTWLDGPTAAAHFYQPIGLGVGADGSIYVADTGNNRIRKIDRGRGLVTTVAGNGVGGFQGDGAPALAAEIVYPTDVSVAADGALLITDWGNERIRRVDPAGTMRTLAGSGPSRVGNTCGSTVPCGHFSGDGGAAPKATLNFSFAGANFSALGPDGRLYVADTLNNRIRAVLVQAPPPSSVPETPLVIALPALAILATAAGMRRQRRPPRGRAP